MRIICLICTVILSFIWGWFQSFLFPTERFGPLFLITAALGGWLIGYIFSKIGDYFDEYIS